MRGEIIAMKRLAGLAELHQGDCVEQSRKHLASESVDLIITDPPYGIDGDKLHRHYNRDESYVVGGYVEIPGSQYAEFSDRWIREAARVLRPGGAIYVVSGYTNLCEVILALRGAHLTEVNHLIWKYNFGVYTRRKFISSHYHILYYEKPGGHRTFNLEARFGKNETSGKGSSNYEDREDVWAIKREYKPGQLKNKNELPESLLLKMIQYSSNESDLVVDFFMGGGSTGRVACGLNRRFTGFEISSTAFDHATAAINRVGQGSLLGGVRNPVLTSAPANEGVSWNADDYRRLASLYHGMRQRGLRKRETIARLCDLMGRGYWSIEKALKKVEANVTGHEMDLFQAN